MQSLEKLELALQGAGGLQPEDEETARLLQMLQVAKPMIAGAIPDTAQAFDAQLLAIGTWLLGLVSDNPEIELLIDGAGACLRELAECVEEGRGYDAGGDLVVLEQGGGA